LIVLGSYCISFIHWRGKGDHDVDDFLSIELVIIADFEILQDSSNCCSAFEVTIAGFEKVPIASFEDSDDRIWNDFEILREDGSNETGLEMEVLDLALE